MLESSTVVVVTMVDACFTEVLVNVVAEADGRIVVTETDGLVSVVAAALSEFVPVSVDEIVFPVLLIDVDGVSLEVVGEVACLVLVIVELDAFVDVDDAELELAVTVEVVELVLVVANVHILTTKLTEFDA